LSVKPAKSLPNSPEIEISGCQTSEFANMPEPFPQRAPYLIHQQNMVNELETVNVDLSNGSTSTDSPFEDRILVDAFDLLPNGIFVFGSNRRLLRYNAAAARLAGDRLANDLSCCEMFWRVEGQESCVVDRAIDTGERVEVEILGGVAGDVSINLLVKPLTYGGHDDVGALVIAKDISDLRRAEAEAIAHKSFIASIADRTPDEIYALDSQGRITWMNERAEEHKLLVSTSGRFLDIVSDEFRPLAQKNLERTLSGNDTECEIRVVRIDGSFRHAQANASPLWKDGEIDGVLIFLRDVTERKREQELMAQSDKLRAVGELAAGVAHNLNNSLTVIQGRAQLLLRQASDSASAKSLEIINNAVEDGTKTLRRILEFARRDSDNQFGPVELGYLITSSVDIARPKWQSKSQKGQIEVKVECTGQAYVMGEQAELREVVLNLIFNAVDAMPEGGTMEIGARAEIDSGCFWVADTGCGMPPEVSSRIFEPFFTTKGKLGSGLGLSASHGIITRHKGEIIVVSEPGEGTRFEVRLPICEKNDRFMKRSETSEEVLNVV
jgi:PAS domain S-box-containing protein